MAKERRTTLLQGDPYCAAFLQDPEKKQNCSNKTPRDLQGFQGWKQLPLVSHFNSEHLRFARQKRDRTFLIRKGLSVW